MTLLASRVGMIHRCTIERDQADTDDWGGTSTPVWETVTADGPCRALEQGGREPVDKDRTVVVIDKRLLVPLGTDVTERDRIVAVTERGDTIMPGPLGIEAILRRRDHLELVLTEIR